MQPFDKLRAGGFGIGNETVMSNAAMIDLAQYLRPGDRIVFGQACGEPTSLVEALIEQGAGIGGISAFIATSFSGRFTLETAAAFRLSSMGAIGALRSMTKAGKLISVAGGGDTVSALNQAGAADDFTFISTAGGAFLEWMEGKELPGVAALMQ